MNRRNKLAPFVISSAFVLLVPAAPAFADDDEIGGSHGMEGTGAPGGGGGGGGGAGWTFAWPKEVVYRPYTLPAKMLAIQGVLGIVRTSQTDPMTMMTTSRTAEGLAVGAGYGIDDKLTVGGSYAIALHDFEAKGPLTFYGEYSLKHNATLSVAASANFTVDFAADNALRINAGLGARYNVIPKLGIYTGAPFGPGPVGQHLTIGLNNKGPVSFDVPLGVLYQATPELGVFAGTNVVHINISNDKTAVFGADFIPLHIGGLFAITEKFDAFAVIGLGDLKNGVDLFDISLGVQFYP
jgi:hypothetical protein